MVVNLVDIVRIILSALLIPQVGEWERSRQKQVCPEPGKPVLKRCNMKSRLIKG